MDGYGLIRDREPLLDQLIPELTGLRLDSNRRVSEQFGRGADLPVVLLGGSRGTGKSTVLEVLARCYSRRLPLARLDLADPELIWPSPLTALLFRLTQRLAGPVHGQPPLHCLRLNLGLVAVSATSLPEPRDEAAWDRSVKLLGRVVGPEPDNESGQAAQATSVPDWVTSLPDVLSGNPEQQRAALIKLAFAIIAVKLGRIRAPQLSVAARAALRWYAERDPETHDGPDALITLSKNFKRGGDVRQQSEDALLAAFRADVQEAFAGPRGRNRVVRPLVLLENADTGLGVRVLKTILEHRQHAADAHRAPDPVVIVGTIGRDTAFREADRCALGQLKYHTWQRGAEPMRGALIVNLTPMRRDDVRCLFDGIDLDRIHPDLRTVVYRITGGNPLGAGELAEAVRHAVRRNTSSPVSGSDLLTLRAAPSRHRDGGDVLTVLLKRLVPDEETRASLIALAAAEDASEAAVIAAACVSAANASSLVSTCQSLLRDEGWGGGDGFIDNPFLRALLLAEFHRSGTSLLAEYMVTSTSGFSWDAIVRRLRNHYRRGGGTEPDTPCRALRRMYHGLTLAEDPVRAVGIVATHLRRGFAATGPDAWLGFLGILGRAPYFGSLGQLQDAALCRPGPERDQLLAVIRRVLLVTWFLSDPRAGPDGQLLDLLRRDFGALERRRPGDGEAFRKASHTWPQAFADGEWPVPWTWTGRGLSG